MKLHPDLPDYSTRDLMRFARIRIAHEAQSDPDADQDRRDEARRDHARCAPDPDRER